MTESCFRPDSPCLTVLSQLPDSVGEFITAFQF